jgi:VanZ family protein
MPSFDLLPNALLIVMPLLTGLAWALQNPPAVRIFGGRDAGAVRKWIPAAVMIGVIFILSGGYFSAANTLQMVRPVAHAVAPAASPQSVVNLNYVVRRTAHLGEYGLLFLLAYGGPLRRRRGLALGLCLAVAMLDEGHQALLPQRTGLISDAGYDGLGAIIAALADFGCRTQLRPEPQLAKTWAQRS